jgi:hypothetical protein
MAEKKKGEAGAGMKVTKRKTANTPAADAPAAATPAVRSPATAAERTAGQAATPAAQKAGKRTKAEKKPKGEKKLSALHAAAQVLAETGQPMTCQEMIDAMAAKGLWTSPGGKTPSATLYSAILRELTTKGAGSRFVKTERGKFSRKA